MPVTPLTMTCRTLGIALCLWTPALPATAQIKVSDKIELAAIMNVAENHCGVNFGPRVAFATMDAAKEMGISVEAAAVLADARHSEIQAYLKKHRKLDAFCANARAGRLQ